MMMMMVVKVCIALLLLAFVGANGEQHALEAGTESAQLVSVHKLYRLVKGLKRKTALELSGMALSGAGVGALIVSDSMPGQVIKVDDTNQRVKGNKVKQLDISKKDATHGYEGLTCDTKQHKCYAVIEAAAGKNSGKIRGRVHEFDQQTMALIDSRKVSHEFTSENKGFEGVALHPAGDGRLLLLCEGNHCEGGKRGRQVGNGRIKVVKKSDKKKRWTVVETLNVPPTANFIDFSGMDVQQGHIIITSQESKAVWVSKIDPVSLAMGPGKVYVLPDTTDGGSHCNVEGVAWTDPGKAFTTVSDRVKKEQADACSVHDQSVATWTI